MCVCVYMDRRKSEFEVGISSKIYEVGIRPKMPHSSSLKKKMPRSHSIGHYFKPKMPPFTKFLCISLQNAHFRSPSNFRFYSYFNFRLFRISLHRFSDLFLLRGFSNLFLLQLSNLFRISIYMYISL